MNKVISAPNIPRKDAASVLRSSAIPVLAEHMVKYTCLKDHTARRHWQKEIQGFLRSIMIGVASRTDRDEKNRRIITSLHFPARLIASELDNYAEEAFIEVASEPDYVGSMANAEPLTDFFDSGWSLVERKAGGGVFWILSYDGHEVATAPK